LDGLPYLSNFACLPGRAGGTPISLEALAKELGVEENVVFHNRFVSPQEMASLVGLADICVTPYRYEAEALLTPK